MNILKLAKIFGANLDYEISLDGKIWLSYGQPIDEILITRKLDGSIMYNEKIDMINIFFDSEEIIAS